MLIVNAATKDADYAHIAAHLPAGVRLIRADHRALIAVQGPAAVRAVGRHCPEAVGMLFMSAITTRFDGIDCHISRSAIPAKTAMRFPARRRACARSWSGCCPSGREADRAWRAGFAAA